MNILLIAPASGPWRRVADHTLFNGKTFRFSMLSLLTVAALSPRDAHVRIVDEQTEDIPDGPWDLVGITAMTALAPRAYALCARFRARGIPVVMGGFHATLNPEDALRHADAVVVGSAFGAWEQVCADVQKGRLRRLYRGDAAARPPVHLPRELLSRDRYVTVASTYATLGCTNGCRFCSIAAFHGCSQWRRPVEDVVAELGALPERFFVFVDDNLTLDRDYALALFRALAPLRKRWVVQAPLATADDPELLEAMRQAGCMGVFVGLESFRADALEAQDKAFNRPGQYRNWVRRFHRHGMYVEAGVIVGFDGDTPATFRATLSALERTGIDAIQLAILTPLPGTPLHDAMGSRVFDRDWSHYDYRHAVFHPLGMTAADLQAGADWLVRAYYAPWRIARRLARWLAMPRGWRTFPYPLGLNLAYLGRVRRFSIRGYDPAALPARPAPRLREETADSARV